VLHCQSQIEDVQATSVAIKPVFHAEILQQQMSMSRRDTRMKTQRVPLTSTTHRCLNRYLFYFIFSNSFSYTLNIFYIISNATYKTCQHCCMFFCTHSQNNRVYNSDIQLNKTLIIELLIISLCFKSLLPKLSQSINPSIKHRVLSPYHTTLLISDTASMLIDSFAFPPKWWCTNPSA